MSFAPYIKEIGRGHNGSRDLPEEEAYHLFSAMLDGGIPELELGAILLSMRIKTESLSELLGFYRATSERIYSLTPPSGGVRPVVIPTYNGARHQPNLTALLAMFLQRLKIPVLLHGSLEGNGRVATAYILRELGIMPSATISQAQQALEQERFAFVPTQVLSPGLATLLNLRGRLGVRNSAHTIVKLIDPFKGEGMCLVSVSHPDYLKKISEFMLVVGMTGLLLRSTEGEAFANPKRRPQIAYFENGEEKVLFEAEAGPIKSVAGLPTDMTVGGTARWIRQALQGEVHMPMPLVNQLACCLYASGYTQDMNQAKAIAAVQSGSLAAA